MLRPGEDIWLQSSNPSTETPEREEKLDRFMERWVELDESRAKRKEARKICRRAYIIIFSWS